jgi:hypothetical protein
MLNDIILFLVRVINSTYIMLVDTFGFLDNGVTYLIMLVIGLAFVPILSKSVYRQYVEPHGYYHMPLKRKLLMGITFILAWLVFSYVNFIRFLPPS